MPKIEVAFNNDIYLFGGWKKCPQQNSAIIFERPLLKINGNSNNMSDDGFVAIIEGDQFWFFDFYHLPIVLEEALNNFEDKYCNGSFINISNTEKYASRKIRKKCDKFLGDFVKLGAFV